MLTVFSESMRKPNVVDEHTRGTRRASYSVKWVGLRASKSQLHTSRHITHPAESETAMSERLETLKKARERMTEERDAFAKTLAAPFDRDKAERARNKFIETQVLIDAIDRAIAGEQAGSAGAG